MRFLKHLIEGNRRWAEKLMERDPLFFEKLAKQQSPKYLWIGCSDSRVPANQIIDLLPGELFVHRNVANVIVHSDLNALSVIQYAVDVLKVEHIIICGHYGCGGVRASMNDENQGLVSNWLRHVQDVRNKHRAMIDALSSDEEKTLRLCELNIVEQVVNVCQTTIVQGAWERGQKLAVHSWIYSLEDGLIHDLGMCVNHKQELAAVYEQAIGSLAAQQGRKGCTEK